MDNSQFNTIKETRAGFSRIEDYVLNAGGIIYGGYVRDEIIKDERTTKFMDEHSKLEKSEKIEKYWDKTYHPETLDRLLIPNDIDVSFKTEDDLNKFICFMKNDGLFNITNTDENTLYDYTFRVVHSKYKAASFLGRTFTNKGHIIMFDIDVCITYEEPPFWKCDMYSNCLVKDINGIRISSNNGIFPDNPKPYKAVILTVKIIDMIIKKENYITIDRADCDTSAKRIIKRISKMILKDFTIKNISWLIVLKNVNEVCMICQSEGAEMSIKRGSHFHKKCLIEFFDHAEFFNDDGGYFFNSPLKEKCYMRFIKEWNN